MSTSTLPQLHKSEEAVLTQRGYKLLKKIGEGSYAKVYLAQYVPPKDRTIKWELACKIIDRNKAPKDIAQKFLPRELDVLIRLNHPHIVHVHSIFQRRQMYYIFMQLAEQGDLFDAITANGPLAEQQCRIWIKQLALALEYMHLLEITHRDIKCENVLVTGKNNVKLADFGFARSAVSPNGTPILAETYCGSLAYASPEIISGTPYPPKPSDVWSLGVLLYCMLNQTTPFDITNVKRLYHMQMKMYWGFRPKVENTLSEECKDCVRQMLNPVAAERYTCAKVLNCPWMEADPRGNKLTEQEALARNSAIQQMKEHTVKTQRMKAKRLSRIPVPEKKPKEEGGGVPIVKVLKEVPGPMEMFTSSRNVLPVKKN